MIFPLAPVPVRVFVNGAALHANRPAVVVSGRVLVPVDPFVVAIAQSIERSGGALVVRRGDLFAQTKAAPYIPLAPLLRTLGLQVRYDPRSRIVYVHVRALPFALPTPFNAAVPEAAPRAVFTPSPVATPRPVVTGAPEPRRTPLPLGAL